MKTELENNSHSHSMSIDKGNFIFTAKELIGFILTLCALSSALSMWAIIPHRVTTIEKRGEDVEARLRTLEAVRVDLAEMKADIRQIKEQVRKIHEP